MDASHTQFTITTAIPLFLHPDRDRALAAAQRTLARYASLPAYNRMIARSGFATEMAQVLAARSVEDAAATNAGNARVDGAHWSAH